MTEENKIKLQNILGEKYEVQDMIYRGGMGEIYLGRHQKLGAKVAIKIMIQKLTDDPELKKRFHREAQLYASLRHPNIIHIYDFGTDDAFDYMVFPFIDGETLQEKLKREGRLDPSECLSIMISVAKALAYASENNVIHRDVKPSNIMMERNGNVLIADFGISKDLKDVEITLPGTVLGSPKYMSPEQILGKTVDSRGDQYALGLIFYEMLAGAFPFKGNTPSALFYSHVNETPVLPEAIAAAVHPEFPAIISKLIAKDPENRYENFKALIDDLTRIQIEETQVTQNRNAKSMPLKIAGGPPRFRYLLPAAAAVGVILVIIAGIWGFSVYRADKTAPAAAPAVAAVKPSQTPRLSETIETKTEPKTSAGASPGDAPTDAGKTNIDKESISKEAIVAALSPQGSPAAPTLASIKKRLFNFGQPDENALFQINTDKTAYKIGDTISYAVKARQDCHLVVLNFSTSGELYQLFPNRFTPDSLVKADTIYKIPKAGSFTVTGPAGSDTVIGYAADAPFELIGSDFRDNPFLVVTNENLSTLERIYHNIERLKARKLIRKNIDFVVSK
jgi:tRNA A-37 threonylcarbamoyl transferase component Bud32